MMFKIFLRTSVWKALSFQSPRARPEGRVELMWYDTPSFSFQFCLRGSQWIQESPQKEQGRKEQRIFHDKGLN